MSGINDLGLRDEITDEVPSELPEQMGGSSLHVLLPGISVFRLPSNLAQLWESYDEEVKDDQGNVIMIANPKAGQPMTGEGIPPGTVEPAAVAKVIQRLRVRFDKDSPLLVVGGEHDQQPVATTISNQPRNRAKKGQPKVLVADMTYLIRESLADAKSPLQKPIDWVNTLNRFAGKTFRAEHGLSAFCNPNKIRYINDPNDESGRGSIQDPTGTSGCGKRIYTSGFKLAAPQTGFSDLVYCTCGAKLRGFFQIERFLKPTAGQQ